MKLLPQLVFAASIALSLTTIDAKSASAALINYAFTVDSPINTGKGFFSFDDSTFSNDYIPEALVKSLSFQFDGDSTVYTEQDDLNYPDRLSHSIFNDILNRTDIFCGTKLYI